MKLEYLCFTICKHSRLLGGSSFLSFMLLFLNSFFYPNSLKHSYPLRLSKSPNSLSIYKIILCHREPIRKSPNNYSYFLYCFKSTRA